MRTVTAIKNWWNERILAEQTYAQPELFIKGIDYFDTGPWKKRVSTRSLFIDCVLHTNTVMEERHFATVMNHAPGIRRRGYRKVGRVSVAYYSIAEMPLTPWPL